MRDEDVERIHELSGMAAHMPFAAKAHAFIQRVEGRGDLDDIRRIVREELERLAGGQG